MSSPMSPVSLGTGGSPARARSDDNIKVIVRFRPDKKDTDAVQFEEDGQTVLTRSPKLTFVFDRVFDDSAAQQEIFDYSVRQTTDDLAQGYNGTVLCYGQTGAGKSHTMMGDLESEEQKGLIPRIFERVFELIEASPKTLEYTVGVSYMEIYNESLRDLLDPQNNKKLVIRENKMQGVYVSHLETFYVANLADVYTILRQGSANRTIGTTRMNAQSSRSHAICQIRLNSKDLDSGITKTGNLFLVDLAGSEKISKTGATGVLLEEAKKINSSLSALGNVINSLTDGQSRHVPYRDSKLTRILQESLGGNSRTTLIINCSPSSYNATETVSTLRFGSRAKRITNSVHVNSELSPQELRKRYLEQVKLNSEKTKRLESMEERIRLLLEENGQLKEQLQAGCGAAEAIENEEIAEGKLKSLEKALNQFGVEIERAQTQNLQLQRDVQKLRKLSQQKEARIEELQSQLESREALVAVDSNSFENKLNYLKTRITGRGFYDTSPETTAVEKENSLERTPSQRRAGLNLRIVKPVRGKKS